MKDSHFIQLLRNEFNFSENAELMLQPRIKFMTYPKGAPLIRAGEICRYLFFIESGFVRLYFEDEEQHTTGFGGAGHFCTVLESLFKQCKSTESMVCETEVKLYALHYHDLMALEGQSMEFLLLSKELLTYYLLRLNQEKNAYLKGTAVDKFNYLCENYPDLVAHIKHKDMASYLNIAQQSFSRILKERLTKRL